MSMRRDTHVVFESLVADATMAASSHNTQPWRFEIGENLIRIVPTSPVVVRWSTRTTTTST
jgi:hypothetical protein